MTEVPPETPETPAEPELSPVNEALLSFTGHIAEAFDDVCSFGLTLGESYVPFDADEDSDCTDEQIMCSQGWVRVVGTDVVIPQSWDQSCGVTWSLTVEVGILRCYAIREGGEAPTESQVMEGALKAMDDMQKILCAAMEHEVWDSIDVGSWTPEGPQGDQHGGSWTFTVTLA